MSYDKPSREPAKGTLEECISEGFCRPKHRSSKHTAHWCKGRPGFIHIFERIPGNRWGAHTHDDRVVELHERCMECGKFGKRSFFRCADCWAPIRWPGWSGWSAVLHGQHCQYRDLTLFGYRTLHSLEDLYRKAMAEYQNSPSYARWRIEQYDRAKAAVDEARARGLRI